MLSAGFKSSHDARRISDITALGEPLIELLEMALRFHHQRGSLETWLSRAQMKISLCFLLTWSKTRVVAPSLTNKWKIQKEKKRKEEKEQKKVLHRFFFSQKPPSPYPNSYYTMGEHWVLMALLLEFPASDRFPSIYVRLRILFRPSVRELRNAHTKTMEAAGDLIDPAEFQSDPINGSTLTKVHK